MSESNKLAKTQHLVERWTSRTLRIGVWGSACFMFLGLIIAQVFQTDSQPFEDNPTLKSLFNDLVSRSAHGTMLMYLGIIILMITPFLRVLTAIGGFAVERDRKFVLVSLIVFLMLMGEFVYALR